MSMLGHDLNTAFIIINFLPPLEKVQRGYDSDSNDNNAIRWIIFNMYLARVILENVEQEGGIYYLCFVKIQLEMNCRY